MKLTLIFFALIASLSAQPLPDAPSASRHQQGNVYLSPFKDPFFYGGVANFAAAGIADVRNTTACEHSVPRGCFEAYPGNDRYIHLLPQLGLTVAAQYGCSLMLHSHKYWRAACVLASLPLAISHWNDATHTYRTDIIARP
jgi:hypothetical protein